MCILHQIQKCRLFSKLFLSVNVCSTTSSYVAGWMETLTDDQWRFLIFLDYLLPLIFFVRVKFVGVISWTNFAIALWDEWRNKSGRRKPDWRGTLHMTIHVCWIWWYVGQRTSFTEDKSDSFRFDFGGYFEGGAERTGSFCCANCRNPDIVRWAWIQLIQSHHFLLRRNVKSERFRLILYPLPLQLSGCRTSLWRGLGCFIYLT